MGASLNHRPRKKNGYSDPEGSAEQASKKDDAQADLTAIARKPDTAGKNEGAPADFRTFGNTCCCGTR
jgi:hypothetical protein